jgi:hypothetical protein
MLVVRCKDCNREIASTFKTQVCGCPNMMTVKNDSVTALDLTRVVMLNYNNKEQNKNVLSQKDLEFQEQRRQRKVRKLDFEVR